MNPHFRKGNKAKHGSGHLWVLADIEEDQTVQRIIQEVQNSSTSTPVQQPQAARQQVAMTASASTEDEDEAAKAVRSILGHNDLEDQRQQRHSFEEEANKENAQVKPLRPQQTQRLRQQAHTPEDYRSGLKRPCSPSVEIQYVTSESKLDAPGKK